LVDAGLSLVGEDVETVNASERYFLRSNGSGRLYPDPEFTPPEGGAIVYYGAYSPNVRKYSYPINQQESVISTEEGYKDLVHLESRQWVFYGNDGNSYIQREISQPRADGSVATRYEISGLSNPNIYAEYQEVRAPNGALSDRAMTISQYDDNNINRQIAQGFTGADRRFIVTRKNLQDNSREVLTLDSQDSPLEEDFFRTVGGIEQKVRSITYINNGNYSAERQYEDNRLASLIWRDAGRDVISRTTFDENGNIKLSVSVANSDQMLPKGDLQNNKNISQREYVGRVYNDGMLISQDTFISESIDSPEKQRIQTSIYDYDDAGHLTETTTRDRFGGTTTTTYEREESEDGSVTTHEESIQEADSVTEESSVTLTERTTTEYANGNVGIVVDQVTGGSLEDARAELNGGGNTLDRVHTEISTSRETGTDGVVRETRSHETTSAVAGVSSSSSSEMVIGDPEGTAVL
jgi:hypothetical protein